MNLFREFQEYVGEKDKTRAVWIDLASICAFQFYEAKHGRFYSYPAHVSVKVANQWFDLDIDKDDFMQLMKANNLLGFVFTRKY